MADATHVLLQMIDIQGREVSRILDATCRAGRHIVEWNEFDAVGSLASGVYFVRLTALGKTRTRRVLMVR